MLAATAQPTLRKPKSKIRLRLGLTPPHPKTSTVAHPIKKPTPPPLPFTLPSQTSSLQSSTASQASTSTAEAPSSLTASTHTASSQQSRADSRDAFAYDNSLSTTSARSPHLDLISYGSISPASVAQPAKSPHHPHISAATHEDDIFSLTDEQLSDRFTFISEIGFGNWGSVWMCKPKRVRSVMLGEEGEGGGGTTLRLGRMGRRVEGVGGGWESGDEVGASGEYAGESRSLIGLGEIRADEDWVG